MKYYNIDENIACTAHGMVHMSDYVLNSATNGFRWSPRYGAWQRQLTQNAENAARRILGCAGKGGCNV